MGTYLNKRFVLLLLGGGLVGQTLAQCPTAGQLRTLLQTISAQPDVSTQYPALQSWQRQWARCGYAPDSTFVSGLLQLGLAQFYRNELPAAVQAVEKAVTFAQPSRKGIRADQPAKALYRLGVVYTHLSQSKKALSALTQAIQKGQRVPSATEWVASAYLYLAFLHYSAGDYQRTIINAEQGEALALALRNNFLASKLLQEKARALSDLRQYEAARRAAERAVALIQYEKPYQGAVATGYQLLGIIAQAQQRPEESLYYQQQAFDVARSIQHPSAPDFAVSIGMYYYRRGQFNQATTYFEYGAEHNTDPDRKAVALNNLGAVYWKKNQFARAIQQYQRALTTMPIGFTDTSVVRLPDAKTIQRAMQKESVLVLIQDKADTWLDWAKASHNRAHLQNALATYTVADKMVDYMRWEHTGEASKLFWREKTHRLYEAAIETCHRLNQPEQAFYFFEKSRAALLTDRLNELGASQLLSPADRKRETGLQTAVNELRQQVSDVEPGDKTGNGLQQKLLAKEDEQASFVRSLETQNPAYFRYRYDTSAVTLRQTRQKLLADGQTLLEYFVGDSAVYALVVTATSAKLVRLTARNYAETARQLLALSADAGALNRRFGPFLTRSNQFYQQFFAPLHVPGGRVIVSPDGVIVPLDLLSRSARQPDWLLRDYAFSYTYSARFLVKQVQNTSVTSRSFLGLAPVAFASGQPTLGGSDTSLKTVADGYSSPTLFIGSTATKRAFLREIPRHRVVQLYAHAQADSTGAEPLIYFADSTLKASELGAAGLLPTQLVVLSACQTGVGQATRGEGVFSLARSLALAGVPSTVTTLWRVDNQATYRLTELFFEKIGEELPADEALQRAKLAYLAAAPSSQQLPPFWAGMVLIGSAAPVESGISFWVWVGGGLGLILLGLGGWRFKKTLRLRASA